METTSGYAAVNGLNMYYEVHGEGSPLVLMHGGMLSIDLNFASLIPTLAKKHQVIGVEAQGHGRTANIDRPITYVNLAGDIVALLDHLGIERAHVLGHSQGGGTVLELATAHGDRLLSAVPMSASVRPDGMSDDFSSPEKMAASTKFPTQQDMDDMRATYERLSPTPEKFDEFLAHLSGTDAGFAGWSDEKLAGITAPTLIVQGDNDFTTNEHGALMQRLIPGSQLMILPGTTHMQVTHRAELLLPALDAFLD